MTPLHAIAAVFALLVGSVLAADGAAEDAPSTVEAVPSLAPWTTGEEAAAALRTPRSALELLLSAGAAGRFQEAAAALNLADLEEGERAERGPELARRLYYVIDRRLDIAWRDVPDRPDGARDQPRPFTVDGDAAAAPAPRHNLLLGTAAGATAPIEIRLERVRPPDMPEVWLIARSTVRSIDVLYERNGPGPLERRAPGWLTTLGSTAGWQWARLLLLVGLSIGAGVLLQRFVARVMATSDRRRIRGLAAEVARPLAATASLSFLWLATRTLVTLTGQPGRWVSTLLAAMLVAALTWLGMNVINYLSEYVAKQQVDRLALSDATRARRHLTYLSVARRVFIFLVLLLGLGLVLAQFSAMRTLGASLLASAGVAGIVLGIAAHGSLSNVMAGIQIALTQLVRIGDAVYFEEQWGTIEDITYTYVIIRTWDQRRIAVPNRHVISHPLENWEMTNPHMIMPVTLHVDYRTPVEVVRRRYVELLEAAEDWDREQEPLLQVVDATEDTLVLRVLCSAEDAATAWHLHCYLREELVAYLRDLEGGRYLPRSRVRIEAGLDDASP